MLLVVVVVLLLLVGSPVKLLIWLGFVVVPNKLGLLAKGFGLIGFVPVLLNKVLVLILLVLFVLKRFIGVCVLKMFIVFICFEE